MKKHKRIENPIPTPVLWTGAGVLTAFGVLMIVEAIRIQQTNDAASGGYTYTPPIQIWT